MKKDLKVALVCDWLTGVGGGEKVLLEMHHLFPKAPIFTSQYDPKGIDWFSDADVRTGWLQKFPVKMKRVLGPLRQRYFSHLNLSEYDLVISVTGAEAKAVKAPNGVHVCYCHVPTQYYWQMYDEYIKNPGFGILNPLVRLCFRIIVRPLRRADYKSAQRVDYFITISKYAKDNIRKYYNRDSTIIYPPVETKVFKQRKRDFKLPKSLGNFDLSNAFVTTSRQVNWKRIDLAVKACLMTQRHLLVIGDGPEHKKLVKMAKGTRLIKFLPFMKKEDLANYLATAKGYIFPSLEPFGIAPVEALSAGCPVIDYGEGGARDYVKNNVNGLLFERQDAKSLAEVILKFEKKDFKRDKVSSSIKDFGVERFDKEIMGFVEKIKFKKDEKNN